MKMFRTSAQVPPFDLLRPPLPGEIAELDVFCHVSEIDTDMIDATFSLKMAVTPDCERR